MLSHSIKLLFYVLVCPLFCLQSKSSRRKYQVEFMDGRSMLDVTQLESDLPDFNQSEH